MPGCKLGILEHGTFVVAHMLGNRDSISGRPLHPLRIDHVIGPHAGIDRPKPSLFSLDGSLCVFEGLHALSPMRGAIYRERRLEFGRGLTADPSELGYRLLGVLLHVIEQFLSRLFSFLPLQHIEGSLDVLQPPQLVLVLLPYLEVLHVAALFAE